MRIAASLRVARGARVLLVALLLLGACGGVALAGGDEPAAPKPPGNRVSNPVVETLGARIVHAGSRPAPNPPPSRFRPSASRFLLGPIVDGLTEDPEQRAALREAVEGVLRAFEAEAAKVGASDDLAGAICFFVESYWMAAHPEAEVPDEATVVMLRQIRVALDTPETKATSDEDKQRLYEAFAIQASLLLLRVQAAGQGDDPAAKEALRATGLDGLRTLLGVDPSRLSVTAKGGLGIAPAPPPKDAPAAPLPAPTPGTQGDPAPLAVATPAGWTRTERGGVVTFARTDGDDFYGRSTCTLIVVPGGGGGDLRAALAAAWESLVIRSFEGERRPTPLLRRIGPIGCSFAQGEMTSRANGAPFQVALYLLDWGPATVTVLSLVQGDASLYDAATERVLASVRVGDPPPPRVLFTPAELVGSWTWSSTTIADYVNPAGQYAGDASRGMGETLTFTAEGRYTSHFLSVGGGPTVRAREAGRFRIEGDMLVFVPDGAEARPRSRRILSVGPAPDGKGSLLLLMDPAYDLRRANIAFYGERFRRP